MGLLGNSIYRRWKPYEADRILYSLEPLLLLKSKSSSGLYMREVKFSLSVDKMFQDIFLSESKENFKSHLEVYFSPEHEYWSLSLAHESLCPSSLLSKGHRVSCIPFKWVFTQKGGLQLGALQGGEWTLDNIVWASRMPLANVISN